MRNELDDYDHCHKQNTKYINMRFKEMQKTISFLKWVCISLSCIVSSLIILILIMSYS